MPIPVPSWMRPLAHSAFVVWIFKALHLNKYLKNIYYKISFPSNKLVTSTIQGYKARFQIDDLDEFLSIELALFDKRQKECSILEKMFSFLDSGDVVFDIGANVGIHSIFLAKRIGSKGKLFAFEPEKEYYNKLITNIKLNDLSNVTVFPFALGENISKMPLYLKECETSLVAQENCSNEYAYFVDVYPGDYLVSNFNIPIPKVVKIDVEGFEFSVVKGIKKVIQDLKCRMICIEIHPEMLPKEIKEADIHKLVSGCGFKLIETIARRNTYHAIYVK